MATQGFSNKHIDFVGYSDQGDRGDGVQIMVSRGYAYIGHMFSNGVTVMDVSDQNAGVRAFNIKDPFRPEEVAYFVPPAPHKMYDPRPQSAQVIQTCDVFVNKQPLL